MKVSDILTAAATVGSMFFPALGPVINLANTLLPADKQVPESATGDDVAEAIKGLPMDRQAMILSADIDLKKTEILEHTKITSVLAKTDITGNSTRPAIADDFAKVISFVIILMVSMWAYAVMTGNKEMLGIIQDSWQMILAVTVPPLAVIRSYFGMRTDEKNTRQFAARGLNAPLRGIANVVNAWRNK